MSDLNDPLGWYMFEAPPIGVARKWFGMFFGLGEGAAWPAYSTVGPQP